MKIHLVTLTFDAAGQGEKTAFDYAGHYEERGDACRLRWRREEEGSATVAELSFSRGTPTAICLRETGGGETEMHFSPGEERNTLYRVPGAGEFTLTIKTEKVENSLSPAGGTLRLSYEAFLSGVRQRILLTLTATAE